MKYLKLILIILILNINIYSQTMTENSLPLRAKNFLNINFPGNNIESVSLYQNGGGYEVDIDFGYKFIFYNTGLWKKISIINDETKNIGIPRSCIHKSMVNVIDNEYPHSKITDIERKDKNFIIKLDDKYLIEISGYGIIISQENLDNTQTAATN
ncbi:PepSY-like domain-containing protein [Brachyspira hyodysenteriae]|uniref:PepSY-like domain-containing protein n=1 Tax=Brachyspira hyodysenteriae TaxID=159 RepID=UPI0022CD8B7D|nr:PepSY-like domain-containing protein [Brachyspira hyodysenteriae]MCZ9837878.1 PepSY-like domain-containing protein [Brachyspira hyodysenteriae]MCZ9848996.1 PepSY-like domain-containing protein [Brachyspira hyodysenteriae]MCZ9850006.1 PepSY-like domain-containing protein [Brachyspira hyodysenteriae]MCZ9861171.1 PepSY-like domain-containing protein [Brachyspira hyodysenteriae]MCZ9871396.1 PepSY-like domain-containing protein [Brachyspira hyodysenteriae]